ncbi:hypothetical protein T492DRAFT_106391 [Pavlovales sp. CCMP2436]|nr:hypothetical protein T492DRAFT_106391 [Pavlovales sp. CCMP2436]
MCCCCRCCTTALTSLHSMVSKSQTYPDTVQARHRSFAAAICTTRVLCKGPLIRVLLNTWFRWRPVRGRTYFELFAPHHAARCIKPVIGKHTIPPPFLLRSRHFWGYTSLWRSQARAACCALVWTAARLSGLLCALDVPPASNSSKPSSVLAQSALRPRRASIPSNIRRASAHTVPHASPPAPCVLSSRNGGR